jgi:hypothetical protein
VGKILRGLSRVGALKAIGGPPRSWPFFFFKFSSICVNFLLGHLPTIILIWWPFFSSALLFRTSDYPFLPYFFFGPLEKKSQPRPCSQVNQVNTNYFMNRNLKKLKKKHNSYNFWSVATNYIFFTTFFSFILCGIQMVLKNRYFIFNKNKCTPRKHFSGDKKIKKSPIFIWKPRKAI